MYLQVIDFKTQDDVNAWVEHARELAQKAFEWQKDWEVTRHNAYELLQEIVAPILAHEDIDVMTTVERIRGEYAISSEETLFRTYVEVVKFDLETQETVERSEEFLFPCTKWIANGTDKQRREEYKQRVWEKVKEWA